MKSRVIVSRLSLLLIVNIVSECFGQTKPTIGVTSIDEIQTRAAQAQEKDRRLIVILKNGSSVSGTISKVSPSGFVVHQFNEMSGKEADVPVSYSEVASVKGRNPAVKLLKNIGMSALWTAFAVAMVPLYTVAALLGRVPDC